MTSPLETKLSEMEAAAKAHVTEYYDYRERIVSLIAQVREMQKVIDEKDRALIYYSDHGAIEWQTKLSAREALALKPEVKI